jgi:hypothetical protein
VARRVANVKSTPLAVLRSYSVAANGFAYAGIEEAPSNAGLREFFDLTFAFEDRGKHGSECQITPLALSTAGIPAIAATIGPNRVKIEPWMKL